MQSRLSNPNTVQKKMGTTHHTWEFGKQGSRLNVAAVNTCMGPLLKLTFINLSCEWITIFCPFKIIQIDDLSQYLHFVGKQVSDNFEGMWLKSKVFKKKKTGNFDLISGTEFSKGERTWPRNISIYSLQQKKGMFLCNRCFGCGFLISVRKPQHAIIPLPCPCLMRKGKLESIEIRNDEQGRIRHNFLPSFLQRIKNDTPGCLSELTCLCPPWSGER